MQSQRLGGSVSPLVDNVSTVWQRGATGQTRGLHVVMSDGDGDADLVDVLLAPCLHLGEGHHVEDKPVHRRGRRLGAGVEEVQHHTTHVGSCMQIATEQFRNTCVQQQERTTVLLKRRCSMSRGLGDVYKRQDIDKVGITITIRHHHM